MLYWDGGDCYLRRRKEGEDGYPPRLFLEQRFKEGGFQICGGKMDKGRYKWSSLWFFWVRSLLLGEEEDGEIILFGARMSVTDVDFSVKSIFTCS